MEYLYGDSSASKLQVNYIDLLRDALDFAVEVLLTGQRVRKWRESGRERRAAADSEVERLADLENNLLRVLQGLASGSQGTPTGRCAARITRSIEDAVRAEESAVKSALSDDLARMEDELTRERRSLIRVLEALLLRHDLPDTSRRLHLEMIGGTHYAAHLLETALHLDAVLDLDIPSSHAFSQVVRVERLMDNLEILAPDKRGWLHKKVKFVPYKLAKHYIVEVEHGPDETLIKLRANPDFQESGFDILVVQEKEGPDVRVSRMHKEVSDGAQKYEPDGGDVDRLLEFRSIVIQELGMLGATRRNLVDARLDGLPLEKHENPAVLVERLVTSMSPVVREISGHSLIPGELVLKRLLSDDRREEIFVTRAELEKKVHRLPTAMRKLFAPLGLGEGKGLPPPGRAEQDVVEGEDDEEAITKVSTPSGELPKNVGAKAVLGAKPAEEGARQEDSSGTIPLDSQDAIPIGSQDAIPLESQDAIPIDDEWLEEASDVAPVEGKKVPEGKAAGKASKVKASEVPPPPAPEPVKQTLSGAMRSLEDSDEKSSKPRKIR